MKSVIEIMYLFEYDRKKWKLLESSLMSWVILDLRKNRLEATRRDLIIIIKKMKKNSLIVPMSMKKEKYKRKRKLHTISSKQTEILQCQEWKLHNL